jgi:membrane protein DedA with SNARE-associated domain
MRLFELLSIQHFVLYLFPAVLTLVLLALALGYTHFRGPDSEERKSRIVGSYPSGIQERNAPFPLFLLLVILGTVLWAVGYIAAHGIYGVKI